MSNTPETDNLARGNHVVPTEFAEQLERERDEARETISTMEIRHAAVMLHTQSVVDELNQCQEQQDKLTESLEYILGIGLTEKTKAKAEKALQTTQSNE